MFLRSSVSDVSDLKKHINLQNSGDKDGRFASTCNESLGETPTGAAVRRNQSTLW